MLFTDLDCPIFSKQTNGWTVEVAELGISALRTLPSEAAKCTALAALEALGILGVSDRDVEEIVRILGGELVGSSRFRRRTWTHSSTGDRFKIHMAHSNDGEPSDLQNMY